MNSRKKAISAIASAKIDYVNADVEYDISAEYAKDVFNKKVMEDCLPRPVFKKLLETINSGSVIDSSIADDVAHAMKKWAISKGVTHYTHWFLPLTGSSAEKHDSFLEVDGDGNVLSRFSGKNLIQGEPDASSFPSGGLRSTFEARGYTAWDPTSPAFIKRSGGVATLCIPTAFCSYNGQVLDKKTPLLRSMQVLCAQAKRMLKCFGVEGKRPLVTLGAEQEYFLIDKSLYIQRPDLMQTGRTLFGAPSQRHQQLEDHYFGTIKPRILAFMAEVDKTLWTLGIPAKTRHNEVSPAQFEIAPMFEELNLATDHNMLVMDVLTQTADKYGMACLLHEKPFAGVNGSGKHNNWSLSVGDINMLNPGNDPHQNSIFLTTLCAVIQAVDRHSDLLRSSTAGAGNDHRLGANEAPPAIISMFLGDQLEDIVAQLEQGAATSSKQSTTLKVGVDTLPVLPCDVTDRNRTSPFAFTGNKFEFRAAGSSQSCASPNIVLNTAVAEAFDEIATKLEAASPAEFNSTLQTILSDIVKAHKKVIFNGNNYGDAWKEEAAKRGLPNLRTTPEALKPMIDPKNIALFEKYSVFAKDEIESRYEVFMEQYDRKIEIEAGLTARMARTHIAPAITSQLLKISTVLDTEMKLGVTDSPVKAFALVLSNLMNKLESATVALEKALEASEAPSVLIECMAAVRKASDAIETKVENDLWNLPKYCEMLFIY